MVDFVLELDDSQSEEDLIDVTRFAVAEHSSTQNLIHLPRHQICRRQTFKSVFEIKNGRHPRRIKGCVRIVPKNYKVRETIYIYIYAG